jgi:hypothetical protein
MLAGAALDAWTFWNDVRLPSDMKAEVHSLAQGFHVAQRKLLRGMAMPDAAGAAAGLVIQADPPELGCTSVARRLPTGEFAIGRNLEFDGVGIWDKHPLLTVSIPADGSSELKHAAVASGGIHYASISGFNEAGVALFLQEAFATTNLGHPGMPAYFIGERVLRQAHTLDEAITLLNQYRPIPMWFFVLADLKSGDAAVVESSDKSFFVRRMTDDLLVQANHIKDPSTVSRQILPWSVLRYSAKREELAAGIVSQARTFDELVTATRAALEYQDDPSGYVSTYDSVLNPQTIQSLLLTRQGPSDWKLAAGVGEAPVSSGPEVQLNVGDLWSGDTLGFSPIATRVSADVRARQVAISHALMLAEAEARPAEISAALASDPSPLAHLARAIYAYEDQHYSDSSKESAAGLTELAAMPSSLSVGQKLLLDDLRMIALLASWASSGHPPDASDWDVFSLSEDPRTQRWAKVLKTKTGKNPPKLQLSYRFLTGRLQLPN